MLYTNDVVQVHNIIAVFWKYFQYCELMWVTTSKGLTRNHLKWLLIKKNFVFFLFCLGHLVTSVRLWFRLLAVISPCLFLFFDRGSFLSRSNRFRSSRSALSIRLVTWKGKVVKSETYILPAKLQVNSTTHFC